MTLAKEAQVGTSQAGLVLLSSIETGILERIPQPRMRYISGRTRVKVDSGITIERGAAYIIWHWDYLKAEWRHALRVWVPTVSVKDLYIESQKTDHDDDPGAAPGDDKWAQFKVIATWPAGDENKDAGRRLGFDLEFEVEQELEPLE